MSVRLSRSELAVYADHIQDFIEQWADDNLDRMTARDAFNLGVVTNCIQNLIDGISG